MTTKRPRPKVASLADAAIRELVTAHPETWFTPGQVVRELERNIRPLYLTNGRARQTLKALEAAGVVESTATGFEHYTQPKRKYRLGRTPATPAAASDGGRVMGRGIGTSPHSEAGEGI